MSFYLMGRMQMGGRPSMTTTLQAAFFILLIRFQNNGGGVVPSQATASPAGGGGGGGSGGGGCPLTQFRCATGRCVNLNVFCDGRNDCGDNSDEPAQCTRKWNTKNNKSIANCFPFMCFHLFQFAALFDNRIALVCFPPHTDSFLLLSFSSSCYYYCGA